MTGAVIDAARTTEIRLDAGVSGAARVRRPAPPAPLPPASHDPAVRAPVDIGSAPADAATAIEAVALPEPPADAAPAPSAPGHVVVRNDVWCNIWIDGALHGNRRNERIEVTAGHHVVRCVNPAAGEWVQATEVAPGATETLTGTLLRPLDVRLEVDATIDGKPYPRGAVVKLKPGNIEVVAGGKKQFITFRESCTLRVVPDLGCYL